MDLPLSEVFNAPGLALWAAVVVAVVQFGKKLIPGIPETGRGVLLVVAGVSALVVAGAVADAGTNLGSAEAIKNVVLTFVALSTAAIGEYEAGAKVVRIAQAETDPNGPDPL